MRVVFDVDNTLTSGNGPDDWKVARPGMVDTVRILHELGAELFTWSANGADHGRDACEAIGIDDFFDGYFPKPPVRPITRENAEKVLGFVPDLTVDDKNEAIPGVPFVLIS